MDNLGGITYQSGTTKAGDYKKSSRFVFVEEESLFGEIQMIIEPYEGTQKYIWYQVSLYEDLTYDYESKLPFSLMDKRRLTIVDESSLGEPLIVLMDEPHIWWVSIPH